jgi:hypothetical protein
MDNGFSKVFDYMTEALGKAYGRGFPKRKRFRLSSSWGLGSNGTESTVTV